MERIKAAVVQICSTEDTPANLARAGDLVRAAADDGATLVAVPENVGFLRIESKTDHGEALDGPIVSAFARLAADLGIAIVVGSFPRSGAPGGRVHNTSVLIDKGGQIVATYDKIHLFDIAIPGSVEFRESDLVMAGTETVTATLDGTCLGLSICYDLRFPELYRQLVDDGAEVLSVPAAFTMQTGKDHWEVLLRARAIESQTWLLAPNQWGHHGGPRWSYGHSMIIDPWGQVVACVSDGEGWASAWLEPARIESVRTQLPCLQHRRLI